MNKLPYYAINKCLVYLDATSYDYFLFYGKLFATYIKVDSIACLHHSSSICCI